MNTFKLSILTPEGEIYCGDAVSVIAPGIDGSFGIWANHAPMMAALGIGEIIYRTPDGESVEIAVAGGMLEVSNNAVSLLADVAELPERIDLNRAQRALDRAQTRLNSHDLEIDYERARLAMLRALNRINILKKDK